MSQTQFCVPIYSLRGSRSRKGIRVASARYPI